MELRRSGTWTVREIWEEEDAQRVLMGLLGSPEVKMVGIVAVDLEAGEMVVRVEHTMLADGMFELLRSLERN